MSPLFDNGTQLQPAPLMTEGERPSVATDGISGRLGVFLLINSLETGGSERQFAELARSLDAVDYDVHLGCLLQKGTFLDFRKMHHFGLGGSLYRWESIKSRYQMARFMRGARVSVAHAFDFYSNLMLIPAARMAGIPIVIGSQRQLGDLLRPLQYRVQLEMFRFADCVISNSRVVRDRLVRDGLAETKIVVIPNGLPDEAFAPAEPALAARPGWLRVGMIARMNTRAKNHELFLAAAARVAGQFRNVEFLLAGDGPLRSELEATAERLGIGGQVRFLGDRRDVRAVLACLDVSVLPSNSESLSNVILESMAAGVPVVASRVGGNPELVIEERTGLLVPAHDTDALANAVARLLRDRPLREQLGREGHRFAESNFTTREMRQRHEDLYHELLDKKRDWPRAARIRAAPSAATRPLDIAIVAASLRYVGGQSAQADLLVENCRGDDQLRARLIPIDPPLPGVVSWVERIPLLRTLVREPFYIWALWRGLKDVDIVHIFSASYSSFLIAPMPAWFVARLRRKPALIHYHSGEAADHLKRSPTARRLLARAKLLVVPSGYLGDVFRRFGLEAKVVPNIVDVSQFTFRLRRPLRPHLVCTRGFHPYYAVDTVVRAFAEVQKSYPEARLDLVGGGPEEGRIRELVHQLGLPGVEFSGVASRQEMPRFYSRADIFINASYLDNMPVSVLEAFASGTPVVTTAPDGIRYLVENERTGLLSPPGDHHLLAQNVLRVLGDESLATTLAYNAREQLQSYTWTVVRDQWIKIYRSLAAQAGRETPDFT
ncbi:MAG: glycosyltransferase [Acidobacteria bacterium]|nr:glycosyltransferase [Acidobacteriota bacterium]